MTTKTFRISHHLEYEVKVTEADLDGYFGDDWRDWDDDRWSSVASETEGIGEQIWSHVQYAIDDNRVASSGACYDAYIDLYPAPTPTTDQPIAIPEGKL